MSWWKLTDFGITLGVVALNPMLEDVANSHPALAQAHSSKFRAKWMSKLLSLGIGP